MKQRVVLAVLENMRQENIDIRRFSFNQMAEFVLLVAKFSPEDLHVFYNYIETCFDTGHYTASNISFEYFSKLVHLFVKEGYLTPENNQNKFYLNFIVALNQI